MKLYELGFDEWFENQTPDTSNSELKSARVTAVDRGRYMIMNQNEEIPAELMGKFLYAADSSAELPCVGDWVRIQEYDSGGLAIIHEVFPRKSFLSRKIPGKNIDHQMIATNIDKALVVQSCDINFNVRRMERYLVMANSGNIQPTIILTKTDLISNDKLEQMISQIRNAGIIAEIYPLSNISGYGIDNFRNYLKPRETYCFLGSSGVGKTTLINALIGKAELKTGTLNETGKGRHTTVRRQLILLESGAMLIDTPGMRELGIMHASEAIDDIFNRIKELSMDCRFSDCGHTSEPGCAVLKTVKEGSLDQKSYRHYLKLKKESEFYDMSYSEKRKKDKDFGKFIHTEMKKLKKYK